MRLFDTHAHLDDKSYNQDREQMLQQAKSAGVELIVNVGYDLHSSQRSVDLAGRYDFIYAAVGIHPHDAKTANQAAYDRLRVMAQEPKVVALGEMGLDYYRDLSPRDVQKTVFGNQLQLARDVGKPVIIHDRDAHGDVMDILRSEGRDLGGVLHCFSGSREMAKLCLELGYYISLAGPVTYQNARGLLDVAKHVPLDRLLIETDSPYLSPHPYRGKRNEPARVALVAERIAELKNLPSAEVAEQTLLNGKRVFKID